jgi:hypothetical protein
LWSYIQAHLYQLSTKPKTVLGVVSDGNRWSLIGLNKINEHHTIAEWAFLTDDPALLAQRLWLLAKPALVQPTSPLVEFLARRTLAEVLKEMARRITNKVNEKLPDGAVSEELIGRWLRDAFSDPAAPPKPPPVDVVSPPDPEPQPQPPPDDDPERHKLRLHFWEELLGRCKARNTRHSNIAPGKYSWIAAGSGVRGVPFVYAIGQERGRVELFIDRGRGKAAENKRIFDWLLKHKKEIEEAFGGELTWQRLEKKQGSRVACTLDGGGYRSPEAKWPAIQDAMIETMGRLEKALTPHLEKLRTDLASQGV